jgi:hypothetical protein
MENGADPLLLLIRMADRLGFCLDWHCGTCGAGRFKRALAKLLDCPLPLQEHANLSDMARLAQMLAQLDQIQDGGAAEALLLLVSRSLGYERTSAILGASPSALHYQCMWHAHLEIENKRSIHRQRENLSRTENRPFIKMGS